MHQKYRLLLRKRKLPPSKLLFKLLLHLYFKSTPTIFHETFCALLIHDVYHYSPGSRNVMSRNMKGTNTVNQNHSWKDLGPVGHLSLNLGSITQHEDLNKSHPINPCPLPRILPYSKAIEDFSNEIISKNCAEETSHPITCNYFFTPKPKTDKLRGICDARFANNLQHHPPKKLTLPNFDDLKRKLRKRTPLFFTTSDISNFFWSVQLPPQLHHKFVFGYYTSSGEIRKIAIKVAPFGWDFSPIVCQTELEKICKQSLTSFDPSNLHDIDQLIYIDDILSDSPYPQPLRDFFFYRKNLLSQNNLIQHEAKSNDVPTQSTTWLGKSISSVLEDPHIQNTAKQLASVICDTILTLCFFSKKKHLQHTSGNLVWGGIHNRLNLPYLFPLFNHITHHPHWKLKTKTAIATLNAALVAGTKWTPNDLTWSEPHLQYPVFFVDATALQGAIVIAPQMVFITFPIPRRYQEQQNAELYTIIKCLQIFYQQYPHLNITSDSSSSIFSLIKLSCGASNHKRNHLLKKASKILQNNSTSIHLSYINTKHNPADFYSRSSLPCNLLSPIPSELQPSLINIHSKIHDFIFCSPSSFARAHATS